MDDLVRELREAHSRRDGFLAVQAAPVAADRIEGDAKRIAELEAEKQKWLDRAIGWYRKRNSVAKARRAAIRLQRSKREAAEARVKVLEEALHLWTSMMDDDSYDTGEMVEEFDRIARAALEGEK